MQAVARAQPESRLQVRHLLIWIVGCAVGFAAYRSITPPRLMRARDLAIVTGYNLAMGTAFGTILTGCGLIAYRRWRGDTAYPSLAGHWLLLFGLAAVAADVAAVAAYRQWTARDPDWHAHPVTPYLAQFGRGAASAAPSMYHQSAGWSIGAMAAFGFLLALRHRLERRWIAVFLAFSLASAILAVASVTALVLSHYPVDTRRLLLLLVHLYAGSVLVGALAILWASVRDRRSGAPTDGLHRLGLGTWLVVASIQIVVYFLWLNL